MLSKTCDKCGFVMSADATSCRECARPRSVFAAVPRKYKIGAFAVVGVVVLLLAGVVMDWQHASARRAADAAYELSIRPPVAAVAVHRRSAKAEQAEAMAASVSESECTNLARATANPYHQVTPYEHSLLAPCYMRREKITNPSTWEGALDLMDKEEAAAKQ